MTKAMKASMKSPYENLLVLTVKNRPPKSGFPKMAAIRGVIRSLTKAVTTVPKATPITMPTAMSTKLPRSRKVLKPLTSPSSPRRGLRHVYQSAGSNALTPSFGKVRSGRRRQGRLAEIEAVRHSVRGSSAGIQRWEAEVGLAELDQAHV